MKALAVLTLALVLSTSAFAAGDGGSIGGGAAARMMSFDSSRVIDFKTKSGEVITISDLKDGYFKNKNVFLKQNKLFLNQNAPITDLMLENGQIVNFSALVGGDRSGGGSL